MTNAEDGTVSVIDTGRLARVRDVPTGDKPVSIAWSTQARRAYVAGANGTVVALDGSSPEPLAKIEAGPGLGRIRFAPGGRLAFVVQPAKNAVHILDAMTNRLIQTAEVEAGPDQVTFSDELAYVRHKGSETVLMIPLKTVGEPGRPVPLVDFPGGQHPPGRLARPTPADGIVQAPGHPSVLVANPEDKVVYFYKEGMAAPMGHFQSYGKVPRAVLVVDRSLRETRPGIYETVAHMGPAGRYELALLVDSPRVIHCFPVTVAESPALAAERRLPLGVEVLLGDQKVSAGDDVAVRLKITDPATREVRRGLRDVQVLTFLSPGTWQQRHWAEEVGEGVYEVRFQPPEAGLYFVFVGVDSAGLPLREITLREPDRRREEAGLGRTVMNAMRWIAGAAALSLLLSGTAQAQQVEGLDLPDVTVLDQEGATRHFARDLVQGKVVAINFIFTHCTTICPPLAATFGKLRKLLGDRAGRDVHLISISVDPANDTPARLKAWSEKFGPGPGWTLVTGTRNDMTRLLKALGAYTASPNDHPPLVLIGNGHGQWTRAYGLAPPAKLVTAIDEMAALKAPAAEAEKEGAP